MLKFEFKCLCFYIVLMMLTVDFSKGQPEENPLSGTAGVLLRDILYGVSEKGPGARRRSSGGRKGRGREEDVTNGLQAPDVHGLLAALESHGMSAKDGGTPGAQFILQLYERLQSGENLRQASGHRGASLRQADTVRTFTASVPENDENKLTVEFHITSLSSGEVPKLAELRLKPIRHGSQGHPRGQGHNKLRVAIYDQSGELVFRSSYRTPYKYDEKAGHNVYDITPIIEDVAALGLANVTVKVTLNLHRNRDVEERRKRSTQKVKIVEDKAVLVVYSQDEVFFKHFREMQKAQKSKQQKNQGQGFLQNFGQELKASRQRRAANSSKKSRNMKNLCERKELIVDFEEMGWGQWIVYPKRFNAFMCSGKCPSPVDQPFTPTNHAVMQSLMRLASKARTGAGELVPRPCCVPSKLYPISMLYYEYGEIVVRHHEDMIVDKCGCR